MNFEAAYSLVEREGAYGLCLTDGCPCARFSIHGVDVNISCRKSSSRASLDGIAPQGFYGTVVRVNSGSLDAAADELAAIARLIRDQLSLTICEDIVFRICSTDVDEKNVCAYCHDHRHDRAGYLCSKCMENEDAIHMYVITTQAARP